MDNYFINKAPYAKSKKQLLPKSLVKFFNKGSRFLKLGYILKPVMDTRVDMNSIEQRINYFHLLDSIIVHDVPGDVIELGCFTGQCAVIFQKVIEQHQSEKKLHLYDSFEIKFKETGDIKAVLLNTFKTAGLQAPTLHPGYFQESIPKELPEQISFIHIDCGFGGDKYAHKDILLYCLEHIYPRMTKNAVCVLMDYFDPEVNGPGHNGNPGVLLAGQEFLKDKPEQMVCLYGNECFHAYFRKA